MQPIATLQGVLNPPITRPGDEADGAIVGQRLRNPLKQSQPSLHQYGFLIAGESTALPATKTYFKGINSEGTSVPLADPCFPRNTNNQSNEIAKILTKFSFVTYNVEHLSQERMENIVKQATKHDLSCVVLIGTRSTYDQDKLIQDYTVYNMPAGHKGHLCFTGITILVKSVIVQKAKVNKIPIIAHRALAVRIKAHTFDITIIGAYSPGDHLDRKVKQTFWTQLSQGIRQLPKRTQTILGIDANGHIGRDGGTHVGENKTERWTENGISLKDLADDTKMAVLNTLQTCKHPDWTWQRRDGAYRGRIDYILIPVRLLARMVCNKGVDTTIDFSKQGTAIDHRPLKVTLKMPTLQELGHKQETRKRAYHAMSPFNENLKAIYETHINITANETRLVQENIDPHIHTLLLKAQTFAEQQVQQIMTNIHNMTVDDIADSIHNVGENIYNEFLKEQTHTKLQKKHMSHRRPLP